MFDIENLIKSALREDIAHGDITTELCVPEGTIAAGEFIAKQKLVVCGVWLLPKIFSQLAQDIKLELLCQDGDLLKVGDVIAKISGLARAILSGERVALNILQRLSGIATRTAKAVLEVRGTRAGICDTRKTTPGMRSLEKYAVRVGGGNNHRFNLADGILIKDNHIAAAGGLEKAVRLAKKRAPHTMKIEVETQNLDDVREVVSVGADIIMLDNMDVPLIKQAVELVNGRAIIEASGNMGERSIREIAECGVDFISIGALTHSVTAADISLKINRGVM